MHPSPPILPLEVTALVYEVADDRLLDAIDVTFAVGPRTVILGPNGAGKSLLLRLCHGLLVPCAGTVRWRGAGARLPGGPGRQQAMVFQRPVLLRRSAAGNVDHALKLHRVGRAARRLRRDAALAQAGLAAIAERPARLLSAGEQQRLALARAWALSPQVLFLDEPTANLDPAATRAVEAMIDGFRAAGTKIVMTTHDMAQARRVADEVVFLHRGQLVETAPAEQFFAAPSSREAAAFLAGELIW